MIMSEKESLAKDFEAHRGHLRLVAYPMLGSRSEADDAAGSMAPSRSLDADPVENLREWLITVVARICLDCSAAARHVRRNPSVSQLNDRERR
jgi:RNA polymerase sigma-70 factor, ECF subfamily